MSDARAFEAYGAFHEEIAAASSGCSATQNDVIVEAHDVLLDVSQAHSRSPYHLFAEYLPKLAACLPLLRERPEIKVLVPDCIFMREVIRNAERFFDGLDRARLVLKRDDVLYRARELLFASFTPNLHPSNVLVRDVLMPRLREFTLNLLDDRTATPTAPPARPHVVLIDRSDVRLRRGRDGEDLETRRRVANREEVFEALAAALRCVLLSHWFPYDPVRVVNADP